MTDPATPDRCVPEDQVHGLVVVVVRPTGSPDQPAADAYGPWGEAEAHDIATLAVRSGYPTFMIDLGNIRAERYRGSDTDA